jgi:hypothetical protein
VPEGESAELRAVSSLLTYGWGVIPVTARVGDTTWTTSLFPKGDAYLVPLKVSVRTAEDIELGDLVHVTLEFGVTR